MPHSNSDGRSDDVLGNIVMGLSQGEHSHVRGSGFVPDHDEPPDRDLPGRQPGTHLAKAPRPTIGPAAVILDCGTSRHPNFSHVLLISPAAPDVLGEHRASRLGEVINTIGGVNGFEWERVDHLHLRAPDFTHQDLLREARVIVAQMLA